MMSLRFLALLFFATIAWPVGAQTTTGFSLPEIVNEEQLDTTTWNTSFLKNDITYFGGDSSEFEEDFPLRILPFPVVDYKFGATGAGEFFIDEQYKLSISYFLIGKHDYNKNEFEDGVTHHTFFNLIVLTDTLDPEEYTLVDNYVTSRNHPDYVGQGTIQTKNINLDYVCFHRPDHTSYAIIGTKIFDLSEGHTIVAVVKEDTSVHFMQLDTPKIPINQVEPYITQLVKQELLLRFFQTSLEY